MIKALRQYGIFLIIPGIVLVYSLLLKLAAGPYWLAPNFDPAYQYLVNGVYLVKGLVPNHTDHPGTPLQILCCVVDHLFNMGCSTGDLVSHVLSAPEFYLHAVFVILTLLFFVTSIALAVYVYHQTGDRLAALLTQLPALSFLVLRSWETTDPILPVVANVFPETLLLSVLNLFNSCLLMNYFAKTSKDRYVSTILWATVGGLGTAVKLTFVPILAVPLIVLSWKNKVLFAVVVAASFFVWTLPIISKYPQVWSWISGLLTHTGTYGSGKAGVIDDPGMYVLKLKSIVLGQGILSVILMAAFVLAFWKIVSKRADRGTFYFAVTMGGILFQFLVVAKHPGAHYLLPGLGLFGALLVLIYLQSASRHGWGRRITFVFILIGTLSGAWQANMYRSKLADLTGDMIAFHDQNAVKYQNCTFVDYYRSSSQEAALFFGDGWNLSPHLGQELFRLYPDKYYYHLWGYRILSFNDRVWANDLLDQDQCVLFRGDGGFDFSKGPYDLQLLEKGRYESVYRLTGTTEKQAALFLGGAAQFIQTGEYAKALMCLLQARKFHYQPDSSIESLIGLISSENGPGHSEGAGQ